MVALGWGGPPTDTARALPGALSALFDLPGARYLLVVEETGGGDRVRAELGGAPEADLAVLEWARRLASIAHERGRAFADVVLTTAVAVHLVRPLPANRWVVLRLDREEGNLALARRALAAAAAPERPALDRSESDRSGPDRSRPDRSGLRRLPGAPSTPPVPRGRPMPPDRLGPPDGVPPRVAPFSPPASRPTSTATPSVLPAAMPGALPAQPLPSGPGAAPASRRPGDGTLPRGPRPTPVPELPGPPRSGPGVPALAFLPASDSPAGRVVDVPAHSDRQHSDRRHPGRRTAVAAPEPGPGDPVSTQGSRVVEPAGTPAVEPDAEESVVDPAAEPGPGDPVVRPAPADPTPASAAAPSSAAMFTPSTDPGAEHAAGGDDLVGGTARRGLQVRQARVLRTAAPEVPPAREPLDEERPVPDIPAPRTGSLFAPVVVVPPPPSPVDDDTTEVPAAMPYPIITAPPLEAPAEPVADLAPEPDPTAAGLPRRVPGAHLVVPTPPAPPPAPAPTPAGLPGWNTEVSVLRRLLTGLRRLS